MVPYLRAANVKDGALELSDVKEMNFDPREQSVFALRPGDVLVTEGSGSLGAVGASAVWTNQIAGVVCFQNTLLRARPRPGTDPRFLAWWCRYAFADGLFASVATGANIYHVSADRVRSLPMTILSLCEQRAIADYLDVEAARIDALIARKQRLLDLLAERRWRLFEEYVETVKPPKVALRRIISSITDGPFGSAFTSGEYVESGLAVVRLGNIGMGYFRDEGLTYLPIIRWADFQRYTAVEGNVLFAALGDDRNHAGRACVAPNLGPMIVKGKCFCAQIDLGRAYPEYVALACSSPSAGKDFDVVAQGSTRKMINLEIVREFRVPSPTLEQQIQIVGEVSRAWATQDSCVSKIERQVNILREHRRAVVTAAVTGELKVPGVA